MENLKSKFDPRALSLAPFEIYDPRDTGRVVIICDHGGSKEPYPLGVPRGIIEETHAGHDIGARDVAKTIAKELGQECAATVLANYTRLAIDLNRPENHPRLMPVITDGVWYEERMQQVEIFGNQNLSQEERETRIQGLHASYHQAVGNQINKVLNRGEVPLLLFIHSFAPYDPQESLNAGKLVQRPWEMAFLWNKPQEEVLAREMIRSLRQIDPYLTIGENQPYSLKLQEQLHMAGSTTFRHGEDLGVPYLFFEANQGTVGTIEDAERCGRLFTRGLRPLLDNPITLGRRSIKVRIAEPKAP